MAWIESHQELGRHPKVKRLARKLNISLPAAVGHLQYFWWWALDYALDGDLSAYDPEDLADAALWEGDAQEFLNALLDCGPGNSCGFLERDKEGRLLIHDWGEYAGRFVHLKRAASESGAYGNHKRWHEGRGIHDPDCPYCLGDSGGESGTRSGGDSGANRTQPNLTKPNQTKPSSPLPPSEGGEDDDDEPNPPNFAVEYKKCFGQTLTPFASECLEPFAQKMGEEVVCAAIQRAAEGNVINPTRYIERTLMNWDRQGVQCFDDVRKIDEQFESRKQTRNKDSPKREHGSSLADLNWEGYEAL